MDYQEIKKHLMVYLVLKQHWDVLHEIPEIKIKIASIKKKQRKLKAQWGPLRPQNFTPGMLARDIVERYLERNEKK